MSISNTFKHGLHHHDAPHERSVFWVVLALVALVVGLTALLMLIAQGPALQPYYEVPQFPIY